jgi:hypothetical protein
MLILGLTLILLNKFQIGMAVLLMDSVRHCLQTESLKDSIVALITMLIFIKSMGVFG